MKNRNVRRLVTRVEMVRESVEDDCKLVRKSAPLLRSPEKIYRLFSWLNTRPTEEFHAALIDSKHRLLTTVHVSTGTLTSSLVHPREVFAPAISERACAIIVVHNHPSGDPEPSAEDLEVTRRLLDGGRLLGIPLLLRTGAHGARRESR